MIGGSDSRSNAAAAPVHPPGCIEPPAAASCRPGGVSGSASTATTPGGTWSAVSPIASLVVTLSATNASQTSGTNESAIATAATRTCGPGSPPAASAARTPVSRRPSRARSKPRSLGTGRTPSTPPGSGSTPPTLARGSVAALSPAPRHRSLPASGCRPVGGDPCSSVITTFGNRASRSRCRTASRRDRSPSKP